LLPLLLLLTGLFFEGGFVVEACDVDGANDEAATVGEEDVI